VYFFSRDPELIHLCVLTNRTFCRVTRSSDATRAPDLFKLTSTYRVGSTLRPSRARPFSPKTNFFFLFFTVDLAPSTCQSHVSLDGSSVAP
jgi:hypothetical protein